MAGRSISGRALDFTQPRLIPVAVAERPRPRRLRAAEDEADAEAVRQLVRPQRLLRPTDPRVR